MTTRKALATFGRAVNHAVIFAALAIVYLTLFGLAHVIHFVTRKSRAKQSSWEKPITGEISSLQSPY